ncbi:terminase large subunit [Vibrio phage PVA1]|uniref:terminase large subunit n=1 Tax=Vibrio phage PVA1 TaxID=1461743 RepID=UPI0003F1FF9B|nr:terminase large subunit [Vibrio phage PVA1]AHJ87854.1 terminase [Vibrio phage PVA1]
MASALSKRLSKLEESALHETMICESTVIGFVSPVTKQLTKSYALSNGKWEPTAKEPTAYFAECLEPLFLRPKRFNILIGGRGSGKSLGKAGHGLIMMHDLGKNLMCIREFQASIADSVHSMLSEEAKRLELSNLDVTEKALRFAHNNSASKFMGLSRNPESVKSAFGFLDWFIEESQFLSDKSLKTLTPTARAKPKKGLPGKLKEVGEDEIDMTKVSMTFCANPASSEDPFSQRFIVPFKNEIDQNGIYEDDMHLIIRMNWSDNPWFEESGLEQERQFDLANLPRTTYDWIWEGGFNDEIENALIKAEWFDACIDAHKKLGFNPYGVTKVTHDPSDLGADPKAVCVRKGNVVTQITQRNDIDVNEGSDWALGIAINEGADEYEWDVGGMGVTLKRDVNNALNGKKIDAHQFNGASSVDNEDSIYEPSGAQNFQKEKKWKEMCKNLRAQCYLRLRDRVYRTYLAVEKGVMCDPSMLISFDSECDNLTGLRSELCRLPIKPSTIFEMYTKKEMREKFKVRSPNLADAVMMTERLHVKMIEEDIDINALHAMSSRSW